jgi:hypothetical protein
LFLQCGEHGSEHIGNVAVLRGLMNQLPT